MRKLIVFIIVLICLVPLATSALSSKKGDINFPHSKHKEMIACTFCHAEGNSFNIYPLKNAPSDYKPTLHDLCLACHIYARTDGVGIKDIPPIRCTSCHGIQI